MTRTQLAALIRERRDRQGLTQVQAAERCKIPQGVWSRAERGMRNASPETLIRMASVVGLTVEHVEEFKLVRKAKR